MKGAGQWGVSAESRIKRRRFPGGARGAGAGSKTAAGVALTCRRISSEMRSMRSIIMVCGEKQGGGGGREVGEAGGWAPDWRRPTAAPPGGTC